jgi:hypothetical protein
MTSNLRIIIIAATLVVCVPGWSQQKKQEPGSQAASIVITAVPPTGSGNATTTNPITGTARVENVSSCHVVVFAHTDAWYVQPTTAHPLTEIGDDRTWNTSTHPGDHYAALLACGAYDPPAKTDSLPAIHAPIVAMDIRPKL